MKYAIIIAESHPKYSFTRKKKQENTIYNWLRERRTHKVNESVRMMSWLENTC